MRVLVLTSVSVAISEYAMPSLWNKSEYCLRHGYSLLADNRRYEEAVAAADQMIPLFDVFDLIWCLDADAVITNMGIRIEKLDCLGPHVTVCEERIVPWNRINCGSVVWRNTPESIDLMRRVTAAVGEWRGLPCGAQTWLHGEVGKAVAVAPARAFNSCVWTHPGGQADPNPGGYWEPGDFVCHPCGVYPLADRVAAVKEAMEEVVRP